MSKQTNASKMLHRCLPDEKYRRDMDLRADNDLKDEHHIKQTEVCSLDKFWGFNAMSFARSIMS